MINFNQVKKQKLEVKKLGGDSEFVLALIPTINPTNNKPTGNYNSVWKPPKQVHAEAAGLDR